MTGTNCWLTTKDFAVLEIMLERRRAFADPIVPMLEHKLSNADVIAIESVEPDIVTLNSRVVFRIDAGPAETRTLVQNEVRGPVGSSLSITTRRGLCMLGMAGPDGVDRTGRRQAGVDPDRGRALPAGGRAAGRQGQIPSRGATTAWAHPRLQRHSRLAASWREGRNAADRGG